MCNREFHSVIIILVILTKCWATTFEEDIRITPTEKGILDKFKNKVAHKLPHAYMKEEIYLIRWLRARNFNLQLAEKMLDANLKWREANKLDTILEEDWSFFVDHFPYYVTTAKDGKPIISGNIGTWDMRMVVLTGRHRQFVRYLYATSEKVVTRIREMQAQGKNVSQFEVIVNLDNYSVVQQGCIPCMSFYVELLNYYDNQYPGVCDHIILVNTPRVFEVILNTVRPLMSSRTRKSLRVYGHDSDQWKKTIFQIADKTQLRPEFGGTNED